jgi:DNA-binding response OmpR family regulator
VLLAGLQGHAADVVRAWLAEHGYNAEVARGDDEALRRAAARAYDAVLVDAALGITECIALIERLRALSDEVAILVQRDSQNSIPSAAALRAGADDLLPRITDPAISNSWT